MRKDEIQVGKTYTNGKKRESIRRVTKLIRNDEYEPYFVYFIVIKGPYSGRGEFDILAYSFAKWAKAEVMEPPDA